MLLKTSKLLKPTHDLTNMWKGSSGYKSRITHPHPLPSRDTVASNQCSEAPRACLVITVGSFPLPFDLHLESYVDCWLTAAERFSWGWRQGFTVQLACEAYEDNSSVRIRFPREEERKKCVHSLCLSCRPHSTRVHSSNGGTRCCHWVSRFLLRCVPLSWAHAGYGRKSCGGFSLPWVDLELVFQHDHVLLLSFIIYRLLVAFI